MNVSLSKRNKLTRNSNEQNRKNSSVNNLIFLFMKLNRDKMLELAFSRDQKSDGRFITGVLTTGIYCLPSCTARKPKAENIKFFKQEIEAKEYGLRPCKRCRPDLFYRNIDPDELLAEDAYGYIISNFSKNISLGLLAEFSGIGKTKLTRLLRVYYQSSFSSLLKKARIDHACKLLTETDKSLLEIAALSGYENQSTFFAGFKEITRVSPKEYHKIISNNHFILQLPSDYRKDLLVKHHSWEGNNPDFILKVEGSENKKEIIIDKTISIDGENTILRITIKEYSALCEITNHRKTNPELMVEVHKTVLRLLGLTIEPQQFERKMMANESLSKLVKNHRGMRIPQTPNMFEGIVWVIAGQAVTVAVAKKLRSALIELCNKKSENGMYYPPDPEDIVKLKINDLKKCGFSTRKAEYLLDVSKKIVEGTLDLDKLRTQNAGKIEKTLLALRGFGPWSVNYLMMRCLGFIDCVPLGDTGLVAGLKKFYNLDNNPGRDEVMELMKPFEPYRSLATFHLWMGAGDN